MYSRYIVAQVTRRKCSVKRIIELRLAMHASALPAKAGNIGNIKVAGSNSLVKHIHSNSVDREIAQQSQEKRIVRIQVSKREFTGYQP